MLARSLSTLVGLLSVLIPVLSWADKLEGRARTWEFGVDVGSSFLDAGFDPEFLGYTVQSSRAVPETSPDNLDGTVPTLGVWASYSFTRFFGLEMSGVTGSTEIGSETKFVLEPDFNIADNATRLKELAEREQTAPGIATALTGREFDYLSGSLVAVFSFNNQPTSKWVFSGILGGGSFSLDTNTVAFNGGSSCVGTTNPNADVGCERAFLVYSRVQATPTEIFEPKGFRTIGRIRSVNSYFYTAGFALRWHFKPRHTVRFDVRRNFAESINKDINEITFGYGFTLGRGRAEGSKGGSKKSPPPEEVPEPDKDESTDQESL